MKIKLYKSVALCSLLALAGCHDFEELNTNPYAPIYDPTVENVSADGIDIDYTLTEHAMASLKGWKVLSEVFLPTSPTKVLTMIIRQQPI